MPEHCPPFFLVGQTHFQKAREVLWASFSHLYNVINWLPLTYTAGWSFPYLESSQVRVCMGLRSSWNHRAATYSILGKSWAISSLSCLKLTCNVAILRAHPQLILQLMVKNTYSALSAKQGPGHLTLYMRNANTYLKSIPEL